MPRFATRDDYRPSDSRDCPACGKKIRPDGNYCGWCGVDLDTVEFPDE